MLSDNYIQGLRINWDFIPKDSYTRNIKAINQLDEFFFEKKITFFVGENGSGKSTMLEAIADSYGFNHEGGTKNYNFKTFDDESDLLKGITLIKGPKKAEYSYFFRAETFFNIATKEKEYNDLSIHGSANFHSESHGESFLHLFTKLSNSKGIYLLDEPEAALSPSRQLSLFSLIDEASKDGSQFIIVSHSPILLGMPNADIYLFNDEGINKCAYEDTDSYKITSYFVNHKEVMIDELTKK